MLLPGYVMGMNKLMSYRYEVTKIQPRHSNKIAAIPENLNIESLIKENPPGFPCDPDKLRYVIGLTTELAAFREDAVTDDGFVKINYATLKKRVREPGKYLRYLVRNGIFECDNRYIIGTKSRGYRFTEKYDTMIKIEPITSPTLLKSLTKKSDYERAMEKKYPELRRWFNGLEIDYEAARDYLFKEFRSGKFLKKNKKGNLTNPLRILNSQLLNVDKIQARDFHFLVDETAGRLHTNLTGIKSELRNFITWKGQRLVSVDIANSQPFLGARLLQKSFWVSKDEDENFLGANFFPYPLIQSNINIADCYNKTSSSSINQSIINRLLPPSIVTTITSYIMKHVLEEGTKEGTEGQGFEGYIEAVKNGVFYKTLKAEIEAKTGVEITDKQELKRMVFIVLFTDNRFFGQREAEPKRIFKSIYPEVYEVFAAIKKKGANALPILLQKIESMLILDRVAKRISIERPDMPIFTIHDSIACPQGQERYVAGVIAQESVKALGMAPMTKYEYWNKPLP